VPPKATSVTARLCPGSKRTAVPAGMSSRMPKPAARSKSSALLASKMWKCEPTCTGRSPVLVMVRLVRRRPAESVMVPAPGMISPGGGPCSGAPSAGRIGSCRVTSLVPSGNTHSTCSTVAIAATPGITSAVVRMVEPKLISAATVSPSRAPSSNSSAISATASG